MLEATLQRIPFAEAAAETVGIFGTEIPSCGCRRSLPLEMKTGHTWETERTLMRGKKCWATVLAGALTAELSLGSLAAVFAIFILSQQELSILYIQGKNYVIHEDEWCTTDTLLIPLCTGVKRAVREGLEECPQILIAFPHPLLAAHTVITQFLQLCWAHTQSTMMVETAGDALIADRSFTQVPSIFCALLIKVDSRRRISKKGVSYMAKTKEQLLQVLWAFSMLQWSVQRISYTFLSAAGFLQNWTQRGFPSCFDRDYWFLFCPD